ncbi:hypothetical protein ACLB2K_040626 [Fragaria x ananassa]
MVDLIDLHCPDRGFLDPRFFLVGKVNTARPVTFHSSRSAVRSMWRPSFPMEVAACRDCYLFTFANERDLQCVKKVRSWSLQCVMLPLNDFDGFSNIVVVPLDSIWICVEIIGML